MKINLLSPLLSVNRYKIQNTDNKDITQADKNPRLQNQISDYPKSYIQFHQSFGEKITLEQKLEIEKRRIIDQDRKDYLWAMSWRPLEGLKETFQKADNEIAYRRKKAWGFFSKSTEKEIRKKYNDQYAEKKAVYDKVMANRPYYENLLKGDIKIRLRSAAEIMHSTRGSLNREIAGYSELKNSMNTYFVEPVTKEMLEGGEQKVINAMLLCGPTGCGKTAAAEAIANETYCYQDRVKTDVDPNDFDRVLSNKRDEAIERYYEKQAEIDRLKRSLEYADMTYEERDAALRKIGSPRTVVIIDEFDRYFNPITCSDDTIRKNTEAARDLFDGCAKLPKDGDPSAAAVTFLCTTNYPKRVPLGEININKLTPFAVLPPEGKDFEDVLRFYLNKANILIYENQQDDQSLKMIDTKNLKLSKFVEHFAPSLEKGAFSNDAIKYFVTKATESYIDNPKFDFNIYLLREFKNAVRDILPAKLQRYNDELNAIGLLEKIDAPNIDEENASELENIEEQIRYMSGYDECFLTDEQKEELAQLKARRDELKGESN